MSQAGKVGIACLSRFAAPKQPTLLAAASMMYCHRWPNIMDAVRTILSAPVHAFQHDRRSHSPAQISSSTIPRALTRMHDGHCHVSEQAPRLTGMHPFKCTTVVTCVLCTGHEHE